MDVRSECGRSFRARTYVTLEATIVEFQRQSVTGAQWGERCCMCCGLVPAMNRSPIQIQIQNEPCSVSGAGNGEVSSRAGNFSRNFISP